MKTTFASSFADPEDVEAFRRCKAQGHSDQVCFAVGDNGIGCWGDDTSREDGPPMCALPPEEWRGRWGGDARGKMVRVWINGVVVDCELRDTMPRYANIGNGCGIDLNPSAAKAAGLKPPFRVWARWEWVDDLPEEEEPVGWLQRLLRWLRRPTRPTNSGSPS